MVSPPISEYGFEQVEEAAGVEPAALSVGLDSDAAHQVAERDAPQQRRQERADDDHDVEVATPLQAAALAAVLERDPAHDQRHQDEQQRQVEAAEQRGVPRRERREQGAAGGEQPDLVAVPHRAERGQQRALLALVLAQDRQQHADAVVEALEHEVADEQDCDESEPEDLKGFQ